MSSKVAIVVPTGGKVVWAVGLGYVPAADAAGLVAAGVTVYDYSTVGKADVGKAA